MTMGDALGPEGKKPELYGVGGWLAFLCVSLLLFTPVSAVREIAGALVAQDMAPSDKAFAVGITLVATGFAVFTGLGLVRMWRRALPIAKAYFFLNLALGLLIGLGVLIGEGATEDAFIAASLIPVSAAWLAYLYRSERVRNTYVRPHMKDVSEVFG